VLAKFPDGGPGRRANLMSLGNVAVQQIAPM